jgi:hypothetical protein
MAPSDASTSSPNASTAAPSLRHLFFSNNGNSNHSCSTPTATAASVSSDSGSSSTGSGSSSSNNNGNGSSSSNKTATNHHQYPVSDSSSPSVEAAETGSAPAQSQSSLLLLFITHHYHHSSSLCYDLPPLRVVAALLALAVTPLLLYGRIPTLAEPLHLLKQMWIGWDGLLHFSTSYIFALTALCSVFLLLVDEQCRECGKHGGLYCCSSRFGNGKRNRTSHHSNKSTTSALCCLQASAINSNGNGKSKGPISRSITPVKAGLILVVSLTLGCVANSLLQIVQPSWFWNPFLWTNYEIYQSNDIEKHMQGMCLDKYDWSSGRFPAEATDSDERKYGTTGYEGGEGVGDFASSRVLSTASSSSTATANTSTTPKSMSTPGLVRGRGQANIGNNSKDPSSSFLNPAALAAEEELQQQQQPLCLSRESWRALSSGGLSSSNPSDVEAVFQGIRYARNASGGLVVNVMARDTVDSVQSLRENVEALVPFFGPNKLAVVVFENDSTDGTREAFKAWASEVRGKYTVDVMECEEAPNCQFGLSHRYDSTEATQFKTSSAIGRMADFRQRMVDYILANPFYEDFSHMLIMDMDLKVSMSPFGILSSLGELPNETVASSGRQTWPGSLGTLTPPYDFSAYRAIETPENHNLLSLHYKFCNLLPKGDRWHNMCDAASSMQLMMVLADDRSGNGPYKVASAFNGAVLYPIPLVRETRTRYDTGDDGQRCEHIGFNLGLQRPVYVNPKWTFNINPVNPGGPTGLRSLKGLSLVLLNPRLSMIIFLQHVGCMSVFVFSVMILSLHLAFRPVGALENYFSSRRIGSNKGGDDYVMMMYKDGSELPLLMNGISGDEQPGEVPASQGATSIGNVNQHHNGSGLKERLSSLSRRGFRSTAQSSGKLVV